MSLRYSWQEKIPPVSRGYIDTAYGNLIVYCVQGCQRHSLWRSWSWYSNHFQSFWILIVYCLLRFWGRLTGLWRKTDFSGSSLGTTVWGKVRCIQEPWKCCPLLFAQAVLLMDWQNLTDGTWALKGSLKGARSMWSTVRFFRNDLYALDSVSVSPDYSSFQ